MKLALYVMRLAGQALHVLFRFKSIQRNTIAKLGVSRWNPVVRTDLGTCHDVSGTRNTQKDIPISITYLVSTTVKITRKKHRDSPRGLRRCGTRMVPEQLSNKATTDGLKQPQKA